jgi:hypothetical protein
MKQNLRLGRVAGITVGAHWSVVAVLVLIAPLRGVVSDLTPAGRR